jgi:tetratricopeptide (TPR) repeat protein
MRKFKYSNSNPMSSRPNLIQKFWQELKRRKVHRVLAIYAGTAFVILEAVDMIFPRWGFPDWTIDLVLYLLILGAVITVILSWIYDLTPQGIVKTESQESPELGEKISLKADKKLRISNIIIAILIVVIGLMLYPRIFKNKHSPLNGAQRNSIAVLPLKIIGDQPDLNYMASGLVESLTYMLAKIGNSHQIFSVIPASEVVESITAGEARQRFGATMVISGSIQMEGNAGRIILNLINTRKQQLVKSERLNYRKENNFILQDEAIKVIVDMMGLDLESFIDSEFDNSGSDSFEANELYLIGKGILREGAETVQDIDAAIDLFNLALKKDPAFALAYSGLAGAHIVKYHFTGNSAFIDEAVDYGLKAMNMNQRDAEILRTYAGALTDHGDYTAADSIYRLSMELDSWNPRLYSDLGYLYDLQGKYGLAEEYHVKAVNLNPENYVSLYELSMFYASINKLEQALNEIRKALELAPDHIMMLRGLGVILWLQGDLDGSLETFNRIYDIDSTQVHILHPLGSLNFYKGNYERAAHYYNKAIESNPEDYSLYGAAGWAYYAEGDREHANVNFRKAISMMLKKQDNIYNSTIALYYGLMDMKDSTYFYLHEAGPNENPMEHGADESLILSYAYLILGEKEKALKFLDRALKGGSGWQDAKYHYIFKDLQGDPDFQAILAGADTLQ